MSQRRKGKLIKFRTWSICRIVFSQSLTSEMQIKLVPVVEICAETLWIINVEFDFLQKNSNERHWNDSRRKEIQQTFNSFHHEWETVQFCFINLNNFREIIRSLSIHRRTSLNTAQASTEFIGQAVTYQWISTSVLNGNFTFNSTEMQFFYWIIVHQTCLPANIAWSLGNMVLNLPKDRSTFLLDFQEENFSRRPFRTLSLSIDTERDNSRKTIAQNGSATTSESNRINFTKRSWEYKIQITFWACNLYNHLDGKD